MILTYSAVFFTGPNDHTIAQIKDAVRDGLRAVKNTIEDEAVVLVCNTFTNTKQSFCYLISKIYLCASTWKLPNMIFLPVYLLFFAACLSLITKMCMHGFVPRVLVL